MRPARTGPLVILGPVLAIAPILALLAAWNPVIGAVAIGAALLLAVLAGQAD